MRRRSRGYGGFARYVPVAEHRRMAAAEAEGMKKRETPASPVHLSGTKIASTFWGTSWCENLESYSDYANRLPRGRTYVRNGSVVDLKISEGNVSARVSGSHLYTVTVTVQPVPAARWAALSAACAGSISSLLELLSGKLSKAVMETLCQPQTGLFPAPSELRFECSCPDFASMCKHVAASLYGVGARLDTQPELLFTLRHVNAADLIAKAATSGLDVLQTPSKRVIDDEDLADVFGIELEDAAPRPAVAPAAPRPAVAPAAPRPVAAPPIPAPSPRTRARTKPPGTAAVSSSPPSQNLSPPATPSPKKGRSKAAPSVDVNQMTLAELQSRGISTTTVETWVQSGILTPSGVADTYIVSLEGWRLLAQAG